MYMLLQENKKGLNFELSKFHNGLETSERTHRCYSTSMLQYLDASPESPLTVN